ncbi:MAG: CPBP family intramembrane metalloprotease [Flavobacteriales bacterium]|nr:CPBP family intramembrane metalloprotease [Flavobacteriales bacterium]
MRSTLWLRDYFSFEERPDLKTIGVLLVSSISMIVLHYFGHHSSFKYIGFIINSLGVDNAIDVAFTNSPYSNLYQLIWWVWVCVVAYFLIPAIFILFILKEKLSDYGLKFRGSTSGWKIYALLFLVVLPFVIAASNEKSFQQTYPFFLPNNGTPLFPSLWYWELFYAVQFFSLEFFFRGFMIHGTRHRFGVYAVFVMVIPYCMIHFEKPLPEAIGSILAGVVLGLLSYRTQAIGWGAVLHIFVAFTMDYLSLWRQGML